MRRIPYRYSRNVHISKRGEDYLNRDREITIPTWIQEAIDKVLDRHPECYSPIESKGNCLRISYELMTELSLLKTLQPFRDCKLIHDRKHFWVYVNGLHIDLTARQFSPNDACPKIWKYEKRDLLEVQTGRGNLFLYFKPFNKPLSLLQKIKYKLAQKLLQ